MQQLKAWLLLRLGIGSVLLWTKDGSKAVREVFCKLYDKGLIYRGERIVNWCPHCLTSISDAEVEYQDQACHFLHLRYPFKDGSGYLELATTLRRPCWAIQPWR